MKNLFKGVITLVILLFSLSAFSQQTASTPQFRREFLEYINHVRQKGCNCGSDYMPSVAPLVWNYQLEVAAMGHAQDMADNNYFSHSSKDGRNMQDRIVFAGYNFKGYRSFAVGENIAQGQRSIAEVIRGWFKSEGHCRNLMNADFKEIGIAKYTDYWVQDFGGRQSFSPEEQKLMKSGHYKLIEKH